MIYLKTILLVVLIVLDGRMVFADYSLASPDIVNKSEMVDVRLFSNLSTAKAASQTAGKVILVSNSQLVNNLTIPADRGIAIAKGANISVNRGKTLTVNGYFQSGMAQVFTGSGSVNFGPGSVPYVAPEWWGAKIDGAVNSTAAIQAAINSYSTMHLTAGIYLVDSLTLPAGKRVVTNGFKTIIKQTDHQSGDIRIINITGSNVILDSLTVQGNIGTDRGEQRHGIFVRGAGDIENVRIEAVKGINIRGDVVYIGGNTNSHIKQVYIGAVYAENVWRNGLSITGGEYITVGSIEASRCGQQAFDIEPNANSQDCRNIQVKSVRGGSVGIIGYKASVKVSAVKIDNIYYVASEHVNSIPPNSASYGTQIALVTRSATDIAIDKFYANGCDWHAWKNVHDADDLITSRVVINEIDWINCSIKENKYNAMALLPDTSDIKILSGKTKRYDENKKVFMAATRLEVSNLDVDGSIAYGCHKLTLDHITCNSNDDRYLVVYCDEVVLKNSSIKIGRLFGYSRNGKIINTKANCNKMIFNSGYENHGIQTSTINDTYHEHK